jgi:glucose-specific phosphotransferase system IIA component
MYGGMNVSQENVVSVIHSPMKGEVCSLEDVPDPAFSGRYIGDGVAIIPEDGIVCTPTDGTIVSVFETKHAIVFQNEQDVRILLHVGIGSMRLKGKGFHAHVDNGQQVKEGDKLLSLDLGYISKKADTLASPVIMTNNRKRCKIRVVAKGHIEVGDPLFEVVEIVN